jgi:hypothetical protein
MMKNGWSLKNNTIRIAVSATVVTSVLALVIALLLLLSYLQTEERINYNHVRIVELERELALCEQQNMFIVE